MLSHMNDVHILTLTHDTNAVNMADVAGVSDRPLRQDGCDGGSSPNLVVPDLSVRYSCDMSSDVVRVGGVVVHVTGSGPGIVLLHANGGDHRDYEAIIPDLARKRTVYAVDWPAHGDSDPIGDVTAIGLADLLPAVLEGLDSGPVVLLGNSVGGFAALRTAIARPDQVTRLVLVNPGGFTPRTPMMLATCRLFGSKRAAPTVMRRLPQLYLRRPTPQVVAARERAVTASRSPDQVAAFASMWRSFADPRHDGRRDAGSLTVPTLLVWGKRDPVLPWLIDGRRAAKALARARVATMDCGHQAFLEVPGPFLGILEGFLADTNPDSA